MLEEKGQAAVIGYLMVTILSLIILSGIAAQVNYAQTARRDELVGAQLIGNLLKIKLTAMSLLNSGGHNDVASLELTYFIPFEYELELVAHEREDGHYELKYLLNGESMAEEVAVFPKGVIVKTAPEEGVPLYSGRVVLAVRKTVEPGAIELTFWEVAGE